MDHTHSSQFLSVSENAAKGKWIFYYIGMFWHLEFLLMNNILLLIKAYSRSMAPSLTRIIKYWREYLREILRKHLRF